MIPMNKRQFRLFVAIAVAIITLIQIASLARHLVEPTSRRTTAPLLSKDELSIRTTETFSKIYKVKWWGGTNSNIPFFSGKGSHDEDAVEPYVAAMREFIAKTFSTPPNVADLGCGDFNIGRRLRNMTGGYVACDIVPELIEYNRLSYTDEDVNFCVLDMVSQELPAADVVFIRQVLQHLDNARIAYIIPKLYQYKWAVITEHIPFRDDFVPNLDITMGSVRLIVDSGVNLTEPPFHLQHYEERVLCETLAADGRIRTTAYRLWDSQS